MGFLGDIAVGTDEGFSLKHIDQYNKDDKYKPEGGNFGSSFKGFEIRLKYCMSNLYRRKIFDI